MKLTGKENFDVISIRNAVAANDMAKKQGKYAGVMNKELFDTFDNIIASAIEDDAGYPEFEQFTHALHSILSKKDYSIYELDQLARRLEKAVADWKKWAEKKC